MTRSHDKGADAASKPPRLALPGPETTHPPEAEHGLCLDRKLIIAAAETPDEAAGLALTAEVAEQAFLARHGDALAGCAAAIDWCSAQLGPLHTAHTAIADDLARTPPTIPGCDANGTVETRREVPFSDWQLRDRISAVFSALGILAVLVMSGVSVHASVVDTGLPIFIEQPWLPLAMAALPLAFALAIKTVGGAFARERSRLAYRRAVTAIMIVSGVGWALLFAHKYNGLSGTLVLFAEPSPLLDWAYVALQLSAEITTGAALFLHIEAIAARYAPDFRCPNPQFDALSARDATLADRIGALEAERATAVGQREALLARQALEIATAKLAYAQRRARVADDRLL